MLLPSLTYVERTGVIQRGDRTLQLQQRLSQPPPKWRGPTSRSWCASRSSIAERLRDPDTADAQRAGSRVVHRTFARYLDEAGKVDSAARCSINGRGQPRNSTCTAGWKMRDGQPISHAMLARERGAGRAMGRQRALRRTTLGAGAFSRAARRQQAQARWCGRRMLSSRRLESAAAAGHAVADQRARAARPARCVDAGATTRASRRCRSTGAIRTTTSSSCTRRRRSAHGFAEGAAGAKSSAHHGAVDRPRSRSTSACRAARPLSISCRARSIA